MILKLLFKMVFTEILKALDLQDWPFHILQQVTDGTDTGVGQTTALDLS